MSRLPLIIPSPSPATPQPLTLLASLLDPPQFIPAPDEILRTTWWAAAEMLHRPAVCIDLNGVNVVVDHGSAGHVYLGVDAGGADELLGATAAVYGGGGASAGDDGHGSEELFFFLRQRKSKYESVVMKGMRRSWGRLTKEVICILIGLFGGKIANCDNSY